MKPGIVKVAVGIAATALVPGALVFGPALAWAGASVAVTVPCSGPTGGSAGLIAAVTAANSGGGGTITLAPGCTYAYTAGTFNSGGPTGNDALPVVTSTVTIIGQNATIKGNGTDFRIMEVDGPTGNLTLNNLNITGGSSPVAGGGLANLAGALTLNYTEVFANSATAAPGPMSGSPGGGIVTGNPTGSGPTGTLTLNTSQVLRNSAQGPGGGIASLGSTVVLNNSDVDGNTATNGGGGGGILNMAGSLTLNTSQANGNTAANGGGIASGNGNGGVPPGKATLVVDDSDVINNTATSGNGGPAGGGIANGGVATIEGSLINRNVGMGGLGGGIVNHGTLTLEDSNVNGNSAPTDSSGNQGFGGGIANVDLTPTGAVGSGVLTIENDTSVNNNSASGGGGGVANLIVPLPSPPFPVSTLSGPGTVNLDSNSQVNRNTSPIGGGILNQAILKVSDGQVSGNSATTNGGGIANQGSITMVEGVVTSNTAGGTGGGIFEDAGTASVTNSTIRGNNPNNCFPLGSILGCFG